MSRPETFSGVKAGQKTEEIEQLVNLFRHTKVKSYLEIGARHGDTFHHILTKCPDIKTAVAVDLPGGAWGVDSSAKYLTKAVKAVEFHHQHVFDQKLTTEMIFGDSQSDEVHLQICKFAPFDAVLIDGDHRYEGVKRDFQLYGRMATKLVAFHDIAGRGVLQRGSGLPVEVPRLWDELKGNYQHVEFISNQEPENPMGIGVLIFQPPTQIWEG